MNALSGTVMGLALLVWPTALESAARLGQPPTPIEVDVQPGAVPCPPGDRRFDDAFRAGLGEAVLTATDAAGHERTVHNVFCLASEHPTVRPLRIRVRIRSDAGMNHDYVGPAPGGIRTADHWLVHVAVPLRATQMAPTRWQRASLWARSDRDHYCQIMGRVIALCTLEALNREAGKIKADEHLNLGADVIRDEKYSEDGDGWWSAPWRNMTPAVPTMLAWGLLLLAIFAAVRFALSIGWRRGYDGAARRGEDH